MVESLYTSAIIISIFLFTLVAVFPSERLSNNEAYYFKTIVFVGTLLAASLTIIALWLPIFRDVYPSLEDVID